MAGIKVRKLTAAQMRKELKGCTKEDLSALLEGIYKSCPDAANYLNVRFAGNEFEKALLVFVLPGMSLRKHFLTMQ